MKDIAILPVNVTSAEYEKVWQLREDVLRKPIGLSLKDEDLSDDAEDIILAALHDKDVVGCVMLKPQGDKTMKLRQMAVANSYQGKGIGRMLVQEAERIALQNNTTRIVLHARSIAMPFYKKLDYHITGEPFTEVGISHMKMEKMLA